MKRDLKKAIQEYDQSFGNVKNRMLGVNDVEQIFEISDFRNSPDIYKLILTTFKAAFVLGYRKGKRDHR